MRTDRKRYFLEDEVRPPPWTQEDRVVPFSEAPRCGRSTSSATVSGPCTTTPYTSDIDRVFEVAFTANTLIKLLNIKLKAHGIETPMKAGIGVDYGRALMIKAGYSGSGINDVVYMGDVREQGGTPGPRNEPWLEHADLGGEPFASNLNDHNQGC
jgi:hypothetical protein